MQAENMQSEIRKHAIHTCWRRKDLNYFLRPCQEKLDQAFKQTKGKLFVANSSRRIGKSWWSGKICLERAITFNDQHIIFATALAKDVEEIILPAFKVLLSDCPEEMRPGYLSSKKKFLFPNGSSIVLAGLDRNPDGIRGRFCDLFVFDEAAFIDNLDYLYSSVVIPMFKGRKNAIAIMISTPPRTPAHPFQSFCQKAELENAYIKMTINDDPLTSEEEKQEFKKECLTETDWRREYLCEFITDENLAVIPEWKDDFIDVYKKDDCFPLLS
jgi:phage FluMu gp28-like protein